MKIEELGQIKYHRHHFFKLFSILSKKQLYSKVFRNSNLIALLAFLTPIGLESENWYLKRTLCTLAFSREKQIELCCVEPRRH